MCERTDPDICVINYCWMHHFNRMEIPQMLVFLMCCLLHMLSLEDRPAPPPTSPNPVIVVEEKTEGMKEMNILDEQSKGGSTYKKGGSGMRKK